MSAASFHRCLPAVLAVRCDTHQPQLRSFEMDKPTPFINSSLLSQYTGQTVRLVGKVQKITGNTLLLQTSDLGNVEVALNPDSDITGSTFVEVTGKVSEVAGGEGWQVREFTTVDCGDSVDLGLVENVVQISAAFPALFTDSN
ncbi:hypothetical protein NDA16_002790 [Ustilago loliicola]|nr:hypothetical protein NDA16_002790 [Ustilago loliicola]